jgi:tripartite-type tricarboxylate transporter receptor subunit TctC
MPVVRRTPSPCCAAACCLLLLPWSATTLAQAWPQRKAVTLMVPFTAGAATDILGRAAAQKMGEILGQQFVVLNRDGATGAIGTEIVAKAAPDGYSLLWGSTGPLTISPNVNKLAYDPLRDFAPVGNFSLIPYLLVVHPSVPAHSLKELVALARSRPGKLNFASSGQGGAPHLAGELLKSMAKIDIVHIPYKGTSIFMTDLASGQVDLAFTGTASSLPYIKAGRLRALASSGTSRGPLTPDLPTLDEAGLPGYQLVVFYGLLAPAGTPRDIVTTLNAALNKTIAHPDVAARITQEGATPAGGTPEQFGTFLKVELAKYGELVKAAGLGAK